MRLTIARDVWRAPKLERATQRKAAASDTLQIESLISIAGNAGAY
jgi:hypothetical protein